MMITTPSKPYEVIALPDLEVGGYQAFSVPTGIFGLDGGAMFGTVPKVLWAKSNPPDEQNRIAMEARALLLKGHGRVILIDTGNGGDFISKYGEKLGSKFSQMYGVDSSGTSLESSLLKLNLKPSDITDVILTHLHFDHAGGAVTANESKELVPTFPNAQFVVRESNLATARSPNIREKASYLPANFEPLIKKGVLRVLKDDEPFNLPGLDFFISHGHTQGQQIILVKDSESAPYESKSKGPLTPGENDSQALANGLIYAADLVPTSSHVRLAWIMGYDLNPLKLIDEKKQVLGMAADQNLLVFFEHDPLCELARVKRDGEDFKVTERFSIEPRTKKS